MRRFTNVAIAIAAVIGSGLIGSGLLASGTAVAATPATPACTFGSSSGNVETCANIISGPRATATATVLSSTRQLLVCVEEPSGILGACSNGGNYETVKPGGGINAIYPPTGSAPAGMYCADTWRLNADGSSAMIGQACKHT
jgi:hypothetical protein